MALAKRRSYNLGFSNFGSRLSRRQALGKKFREIEILFDNKETQPLTDRALPPQSSHLMFFILFLLLEEFSSDAPPDCRAIRDPSNSCLGYSK